ncbi:MAG: YggS family pyridoxal phosphate-dependent enzyme [Longimicrobiales bacterium]
MTAQTLESGASYRTRLADTLPRVRERMSRAADLAGRSLDDIRLVAVSKGHPLTAVEAALEAGLTDLGENRVGELEDKAAALGDRDVRWHMIGHLQRRKAPRLLGRTHLIHSMDSPRLAERLSRVAVEADEVVDVLAQVNTSGEDSKGGFDLENAVERVHEAAELPNLRVRGLMTMAPYVAEPEVLTRTFAGLRSVLERLQDATDRVGHELSMGMTNDLEVAIREGSTMVRIGTALFGERNA